MSAVTRLYTPEILALAVELAGAPLNPAMPWQGRARSASCGSTLDLSLDLGEGERVVASGARAQACAIGQASAALFLRGVKGRDRAELDATRAALEQWLAGEGAMPDWPGLVLLDPARAFPGRHGAILLPWNAALDALSRSANRR
ncbi:iron-sulfur cluster assembly scaffold protein [Novosphingobium flavum]|uniref:iron-sulfur cluster assembly scaffold protein n=1 Tax=Novosphingobium aerophilum TaxID=2839843 RepID=UPI00163A3524|nr:iron-sulfur cluster assembly scaffold protein [Novosphingobium aerophilum]MBC2660451.1 iron-sulfur cluster assembly scaffold protein [Novosphingobium aerophilum]